MASEKLSLQRKLLKRKKRSIISKFKRKIEKLHGCCITINYIEEKYATSQEQ